MASETFDVIIVGGGPAGTASALHLLQSDPTWRHRLLLLEKEHYPREKLCAGAVTRYGESELLALGLLPVGVPHVDVREARFRFEDLTIAVRNEPVFRVTRRAELDAWLASGARERGAQIREGEAVTGVEVGRDHVTVTTTRSRYRARVLVGADGSNGIVRRAAGLAAGGRVARLLEVITPEDPATTPEFARQFATFDFSPLTRFLQGYYWDFPSLVAGEPHMNRGVFDARVRSRRPRASLQDLLAENMYARSRSLKSVELQGHPIHWFRRRGPFSRPRVLLVGDAAGVDPLLGEGISFAIGYGRIAAGAIEAAFRAGNFSFRDYSARVLADPLGRTLGLRGLAARILYQDLGRRLWRLLWRAVLLGGALRLLPGDNEVRVVRGAAPRAGVRFS